MIGAVVDKVLKEMENAANGGMKAADDYKDTETGLLMCGKCHTRKQKKISFLGEERIVGCLCRCAAEELEKGRAEREAQDCRTEHFTVTPLKDVMRHRKMPYMQSGMWNILRK